MKARWRLTAALAVGAACSHANAAELEYPTRPIRLISPFTPGGGNDLVSRTIALAMSKNIGQSIVVDNRPGANTIVGMEIVAKAAPDGYTLITTSSTQGSTRRCIRSCHTIRSRVLRRSPSWARAH